jgi:predicted patatin/cPLA2 family phospholipase
MSASTKKKLAIILGGGGMSSSYSVGFLKAIKNTYKIQPDILIGASGSAGTASYFLTSDFAKAVRRIWLKEILSPKFISGKGLYKKVNIDYLIDIIFKEKVPLKTKEIMLHQTKLYIPAINSDTGTIHYFSNKEINTNWMEVLRATKAIPIFYNKEVSIGNKKYHDSHKSTHPENHINFAKKQGATHIIVVHNTSIAGFWESKILEYFWFRKYKSKEFLKRYRENHEGTPTEHHIRIEPSHRPFANILDTKKEDIRETIAMGYTDARQNKKLKKFLQDFNQTK